MSVAEQNGSGSWQTRSHLLELLLELSFFLPSSSLLLLELLLDEDDEPLASSPRSAPCAATCETGSS